MKMLRWHGFILMLVTTTGYGNYFTSSFLREVVKAKQLKKSLPYSDSITDEQLLFLKLTDITQYRDILKPARYEKGVYQYNILNMRSYKHVKSDLDTVHSECKRVWMHNGKVVRIKTLRALGAKKVGHIDQNKFSFSYCLSYDSKVDPSKALYFFHGASGVPLNWKSRRALAEVRYQWREKSSTPVWLSVSLGRLSSLAEKHNDQRFEKNVMVFLEKRVDGLLGSKPKVKYGLGISMGGFNLTHLILNRPKLFKRAFLVCPAISTVNSHTPKNEFQAFLQRTHALKFLVRGAMKLIPKEYTKMEFLDKVEPLKVGQKKLSYETTPFFMETSHKDEFGFNEGGQLFAFMARTYGTKVGFKALKGRHCALRPQKIVDFLVSADYR